MTICTICFSSLLCLVIAGTRSPSFEFSSDLSDQECHSGHLPRKSSPTLFRMSPYSQSLSPPEQRRKDSADEVFVLSQEETQSVSFFEEEEQAVSYHIQGQYSGLYDPDACPWIENCPCSPPAREFHYPNRKERATSFSLAKPTPSIYQSTPPLMMRGVKAKEVKEDLPEIKVLDSPSNGDSLGDSPVKSPPVPVVQRTVKKGSQTLKAKAVAKK